MRERGKGEWPRPFSFSSFKAPAGNFPPSAEKVRRLGAKGTKEQGLAGVCAPSRRRPSAEKVRRLGAKGTKEQGFAGVCAPSPCRPSAEKAWRLGAKGTKEQGVAGICSPSRHRPSVNPGPKKQEKAARQPAELAPHCRQNLVSPLRGANILP